MLVLELQMAFRILISVVETPVRDALEAHILSSFSYIEKSKLCKISEVFLSISVSLSHENIFALMSAKDLS